MSQAYEAGRELSVAESLRPRAPAEVHAVIDAVLEARDQVGQLT
ncbi:MAG: hypothetical protein WD844_08035 [Thermoleophilaceae bacterium]